MITNFKTWMEGKYGSSQLPYADPFAWHKHYNPADAEEEDKPLQQRLKRRFKSSEDLEARDDSYLQDPAMASSSKEAQWLADRSKHPEYGEDEYSDEELKPWSFDAEDNVSDVPERPSMRDKFISDRRKRNWEGPPLDPGKPRTWKDWRKQQQLSMGD